jgi:hypothetical protein
VLRRTERQSQRARAQVYAQRADLGVRDGESRGWASGIRAAPAQRPDDAALVEQLERIYHLSNCARRPRPARCIQRRPRALCCCSHEDDCCLCAWCC